MTTAALAISNQQKQQYRDEGYMILERAIPEHFIELLRDECRVLMDQMDAKMESEQTNVGGLSHRGSRYFIANSFKQHPRLRKFLFSDLMADVCRATLGDTAYLFWEQYVVKGAESGMPFGWHQDSGYVSHEDHEPYLTCWCALDDVTEENGTVRVLPFSQVGIRTRVKHIRDPASNDRIGYFGDKKGVAAIVPTGSIVAFTSVNFHCSGANTTPRLRRTYLAQYSAEPIMTPDGSEHYGSAEPFLKDDKVVEVSAS